MAEPRVESKYARTLVQLDNGVKIPPKGWKCERCDKTENLWLNLTSGAILCGRKMHDGSGGNGHALENFEQTRHPLCVKLGTISREGAADVFSYAEDDMVEDPLIKQHLKHWGIDMDALSRTEKTIAEMEIDQNMSYEFNRLQESGKELTPLYGPGLTGMINIGSSCYLASVMQVLFTIPHFVDRYVTPAEDFFRAAPADPHTDFQIQMAKLGNSLHSGRYSHPDIKGPSSGVSPRSFKHLVGKGHPEFSTFKQQDGQLFFSIIVCILISFCFNSFSSSSIFNLVAMEFYQYLLEFIDRKERVANSGKPSPSQAFKFRVEDRIECDISHQVRYTSRLDNVLSLPVPLEAATNKAELAAYEEAKKTSADPSKLPTVRPKIPFVECLKAFASAESIPDFYSSATQAKGAASKTTRLGSFPPFLMVQVRKFTLGDDWVPRKLDILLEVPDEIHLGWLRGTGLQPGEKELPEDAGGAATIAAAAVAAQQAAPQIDESLVMQLVDMGFDLEGCKKAVHFTRNAGVEPAMNWVLEHMGDADFTTPLVLEQPAAPVSAISTGAKNLDAEIFFPFLFFIF